MVSAAQPIPFDVTVSPRTAAPDAPPCGPDECAAFVTWFMEPFRCGRTLCVPDALLGLAACDFPLPEPLVNYVGHNRPPHAPPHEVRRLAGREANKRRTLFFTLNARCNYVVPILTQLEARVHELRAWIMGSWFTDGRSLLPRRFGLDVRLRALCVPADVDVCAVLGGLVPKDASWGEVCEALTTRMRAMCADAALSGVSAQW